MYCMCGNAIKFPSETNGNSTYCGDEVYKYWSVFTQGRCFFFHIKVLPVYHFFKIRVYKIGTVFF